MRENITWFLTFIKDFPLRLYRLIGQKFGFFDEATADITDLSRKEWKRVAKESWAAIFDRRLLTLSGGVAFYTTIALLPTTAAVLAIISRTISPEEAQALISEISHLLPEEFARFVQEQLPMLVNQKTVSGLALTAASILALWTGSGAMDNVMNALNAAYGLREKRSFWRFKSTSAALLIVVVSIAIAILALLLISSQGLAQAGVAPGFITTFSVVRWVTIFLLTSAIVLILYRFAPNHTRPRIKWMSWGAVIASIVWLIGTAIFFYYVQFIADFSQAFGILAGMFVLMAWVELSAFILVLGATINGRLTHHAEKVHSRSL